MAVSASKNMEYVVYFFIVLMCTQRAADVFCVLRRPHRGNVSQARYCVWKTITFPV